jgi:hypothetical protein
MSKVDVVTLRDRGAARTLPRLPGLGERKLRMVLPPLSPIVSPARLEPTQSQ